jgi:Flp pilus assembly protein TadG/cytoskeletal protein CcmA (bactofilin family)
MKTGFCKGQKGSVSVIVAILLPVILGLIGLGFDLGNLVLSKTQLRNAVDAAILAAAEGMGQCSDPSTAIRTYLNQNGCSSATFTTDSNVDPVKNSWNLPELNVHVSQSIPTDFLRFFGTPAVTLTFTTEAIYPQSLQPPFTYLLFSGGADTELTMNGHNHAYGSAHANGTLDVNGSEMIGGNVEGVHGVTLHGSENISGYVQADTLNDIHISGHPSYGGTPGGQAGAVDIPMPDFTQEIINAAGQTYNATTTITGINDSSQGSINPNGPIYVNGDVTVNGHINWTGTILATGNIDIGGDSSVSDSQLQGSNQLFLYSKNGNITIHGNCTIGSTTANCIGYAPNGSITVSGNNTWYGRLVGNSLTLNGNGNFNGENVEPNMALPYGVATIDKPQIIS